MKTIFVLFFLISFSALAQVRVHLNFKSPVVKQGEIAPVTIVMGAQDIQGLSLVKSKGTTLGEIFYLYQVSPFMRSEGSPDYEAEAEVIIIKTLPVSPLKAQIQGANVDLSWNDFQFQPVEAPKSFIFENFEIPTPLEIAKYLLGLAILFGLVLGGWKISKALKAKRAHKLKRAQEKKNLISANNYADVVLVWKDKPKYLKLFPEIDSEFRKLEDVLFKYQFKQSQSQHEVDQVMEAYRSFSQKVSEVLRGV